MQINAFYSITLLVHAGIWTKDLRIRSRGFKPLGHHSYTRLKSNITTEEEIKLLTF